MNFKGRNKVDATFSMSSMTDIVFLLLIFFMLTSTLVTTNALDLVLPSSTAKTVKKQTMSVSIDQGLNYYLDSEKIQPELLESILVTRIAGEEEATVVLRVEKGGPIEYAVEVMDIAYRNQIKIVLATDPKKEK
jgi:biopolymer transport protein ExbD